MTRAHWVELLVVTALCAALVASMPLHAGVWGWSWDALNHHVYLGLISESPRWHLDVTAASVQSWQYPYLYWPVYRLTLLPLHGAVVGALWGAFLCALIVPPIWLTSLRLLPRADPTRNGAAQAIFERSAACALALMSVVVLSSLGTTANDPLATVPLLWALAVMAAPTPSNRRAAAAAALWGVSAAFKLSNALAIPLLLVWWWRTPGWPLPLRRGLGIGAGALTGFVLAYAPWGWQLWRHMGNPFYPFFKSVFGA
jgi:hypothetical protein